MRPTSEWVEMGELSFSLTKKGGRQQKLSGDEAEELGVAEFMARSANNTWMVFYCIFKLIHQHLV